MNARCALPILLAASCFITLPNLAQEKEVLIRCDDIGMNHAVNQAFERVAKLRFPVSASVMFACPWYQEAVEMLKAYPNVSVGIHLTLNAEWKHYRWGPVSGDVPSLADSNGYFFPSRAAYFANGPKDEEVERELRAQIGRAMRSGLRIDYVDYHMGTAVDTKEYRAIVSRLAAEFGLGISRCCGEQDLGGYYSTDPDNKIDTLLLALEQVAPGPPRLMVFHVGLRTPEMDALVDLNATGLHNMSVHREAELEALISEDFQDAIRDLGIRLINYGELIERLGKTNAVCPEWRE
jgi:hypothetical protein